MQQMLAISMKALNFCIPLLKKTAYKENLMPKFIITQTDRYEVEAETLEEVQENWRNELLTGIEIESEYIDGSTTYEEVKEEADV